MLDISINQNIASFTLNRPEVHNAFNDELIQQLISNLEKIDQDPKIRVVILAANGKSFCAGADIHWMQQMANYSREQNLRDARSLARLMQVLNNLSKPTIALVQGPAYGGGVGLVACCDIALGTPNAIFCLSEVKIGLVPAAISPYVIKAIGERAARRYFLTAEKFTAEEGLQLGLLHAVVEPTDLLAAGEKFANTLLTNSPKAITSAKQLIAKVANRPIDNNLLNLTAETIADIRVSDEGQEGLKAFLEKRTPAWQKS